MEKQKLVNPKWVTDFFTEICGSLDSILDIDKLTALFVNKVAEIFRVNKVSFMMIDETKSELSIKASQGLNTEAVQMRPKLGDAFGGWVAKEGKSLLVKDVEAEFPELSKNRLSRYLTKSFVIVPVKIRDKVMGVLSLTDKKDQDTFSEDDLKMLNLFSHFFALHIENINLSEKNQNLLIADSLTGLFNHRYFQEQLLEEIYRAERYKRHLSLMMFDIDNFSQYNHMYGYAVGDSALKETGAIIKENTRLADIACRYGAGEFVVILPETRLKEALIVGEKIREKINYAIFAYNRESALGMSRLTVSIGVAEHRIGLSSEELIKRLNSALQDAKQKGKNCVCAFR